MPSAAHDHTTPTRRGAMRLSAAALFASLGMPALARSAPVRVTPIAALQKRLTGLTTARAQMDDALIEMPSGPDYDALHKRFDQNLDDCLAVQGEIVALPAETLEDAAVQATVAYYRLEGLTPYGEGDASDIRDIRASLASIVLAIVKVSSLDIDQLGMGEMGGLCARYAPGGRAEA
jgi:hypothetical protein